MDKIDVYAENEIYIKIKAHEAIMQELHDAFSFTVPNYFFIKKKKAHLANWDGKIRLFNPYHGRIYKGLLEHIKKFAKINDYEIETHDNLDIANSYSIQEALEFYRSLGLPEEYEERDYQLEAFAHLVKHSRGFLVSPTGSGKSLIIYMLLRYFKVKTLIIVDSLNLLKQMKSDFSEYGFDVENEVHLVKSGSEKYSDKNIIVSTWQSAHKQDKKWFDQFDMVIGDEAHKFKATCLTKIMESLPNCKLRFGCTGSTDGSQVNLLVLEGLFGAYKQFVTTRELIDQGTLSESNIKCITLEYSDEERKIKRNYADEIEFLFSNPRRNKFLCNLALSLKGNTMLLFSRIKHGKLLYEYLKEKYEHDIYFIAGETEADDREYIRKIVNTHKNSIIVGSLKTCSTGVNIPNLNNMIFSAPTKAQTTILQSLGRGLRKTKEKDTCTYFDISDDLSWRKRLNYTFKHFAERMKIYIKEKHNYKQYKVKI